MMTWRQESKMKCLASITSRNVAPTWGSFNNVTIRFVSVTMKCRYSFSCGAYFVLLFLFPTRV